MKKCCVCGLSDQDYDRTGFQDETGYYCFNCKTKEQVVKSEESSAKDNLVTDQSKNKVASLIKGFSIFIGVCFFIFALIFSVSIPSDDGSGALIVFAIYFGMGFVVSLFMYAAGEIVQLLHNIDHNTKKV